LALAGFAVWTNGSMVTVQCTPATPMSERIDCGHLHISESDCVRCAFSDRIVHSRMPLDPTHVRFKQTCVWPMTFLSGVHCS
jgi:hypothetical protein